RFNRFCGVLAAIAAAVDLSATAQTSTAPISVTFSNATPAGAARRPSVVLIEADGLGYGDLSCYGQSKYETPNLDKLAADGVRFTNYVVGEVAPVETILFGRDTKKLHLHPADETSIVQAFQNAGYRAGFFGEWTSGDENSDAAPWKKGFYEFVGYFDPLEARNPYSAYVYHYLPHSIYDEKTRQWSTYSDREPLAKNSDGAKKQYIPDLLTLGAANFIKNNHPDFVNHYQPFFLWLNYPIPGDGKVSPPSDAPYSDEPWPQGAKNHAAMVSRLDGYIGQLRAQLLKYGLTNDIIVAITSGSIARRANGFDPEFFHSQPGTNDFRSPMILDCPGRVPTNRVSGVAWSPVDLLPTMAEISRVTVPPAVEGKSILAEIADKSAKPEQKEKLEK
ncbi:MAG TPA: sulfatase-like hydrolase/transferase, partial [Desulfuromonadaceae bacterium]|nr:sulfatase-like hydrolase/transferase [Desulfuromonadaceae bacterium]